MIQPRSAPLPSLKEDSAFIDDVYLVGRWSGISSCDTYVRGVSSPGRLLLCASELYLRDRAARAEVAATRVPKAPSFLPDFSAHGVLSKINCESSGGRREAAIGP